MPFTCDLAVKESSSRGLRRTPFDWVITAGYCANALSNSVTFVTRMFAPGVYSFVAVKGGLDTVRQARVKAACEIYFPDFERMRHTTARTSIGRLVDSRCAPNAKLFAPSNEKK